MKIKQITIAFEGIISQILKSIGLIFLLVIAQVAAFLGPFHGLYAVLTGNKSKALEILKGYDLLGNTVANGVAGEYISTRANRARIANQKWGCVLCKVLDWVDKGHCQKYGP